MMDISITNVCLDLGAGRRGAADGPSAIHKAGIVAALEAMGHRVATHHEILQDDSAAAGPDPRTHYLDAIASACTRLADTVEHTLRAGRFPLILGGDHSQAIGSVAGLVRYFRPQGKELGVFWVDAHADMNTPETSPSGNLHGMPLAILLGHGPKALVSMNAGLPALSPKHVVLFGVRQVDADEEPLVQRSGVRVFTRNEIRDRGIDVCLCEALDLLSGAGAGIHLSYDLDACDPGLAPGVTTPVSRGLDQGEALKLCEMIARSGRLTSMEIVELNPTSDLENRTGELAVRLVASALAGSPRPSPGLRGTPLPPSPGSQRHRWERQVAILARSLFRDMRAQGFATGDVVGFASALLQELISHINDAKGLESSDPSCRAVGSRIDG